MRSAQERDSFIHPLSACAVAGSGFARVRLALYAASELASGLTSCVEQPARFACRSSCDRVRLQFYLLPVRTHRDCVEERQDQERTKIV